MAVARVDGHEMGAREIEAAITAATGTGFEAAPTASGKGCTITAMSESHMAAMTIAGRWDLVATHHGTRRHLRTAGRRTGTVGRQLLTVGRRRIIPLAVGPSRAAAVVAVVAGTHTRSR